MLSHNKCCYARTFPQCISVRAFGKLFLETARSAIKLFVVKKTECELNSSVRINQRRISGRVKTSDASDWTHRAS